MNKEPKFVIVQVSKTRYAIAEFTGIMHLTPPGQIPQSSTEEYRIFTKPLARSQADKAIKLVMEEEESGYPEWLSNALLGDE